MERTVRLIAAPRKAPAATHATPARAPAHRRPAGNAALAARARAVQRTVLADVDPDTIKAERDAGRFRGAYNYADQAEIAASAVSLGQLYHMRVYPIRVPQPHRLKANEALILVGHGGGGAFMGLSPQELRDLLQAWGVGEGMHVVLAGCSTAEAGDAIGVVQALTGRPPVVNADLAFTPKPTAPRPGEFTIKDADSRALFDEYKRAQKEVDHHYAEQHDALLAGLFADVSPANLAVKRKLFDAINRGVKGILGKPNLDSAKNDGARCAILQGAWKKGYRQLLNVKLIDAVLQALKEAAEADTEGAFRAGHQQLVLDAMKAAAANNELFVAQLSAQPRVTRRDYTLDVVRQGGPLPNVVRVRELLRRALSTAAAGQHGAVTDALADQVMAYLPGQRSLEDARAQQPHQ